MMTRDVRTCRKEDSLEQAARIMWEADVGCVVVVDAAGRLVGMITDRDVAMAAFLKGVALRDAVVESVMARHVLTCTPTTPLATVESLMRIAQIRRLPVVGPDEKVLGLVTLGDLARVSVSSPIHLPVIPGVAKTLAAVTERRSDVAAQ